MNLKKATLTAAVAAALGVGMVGEASAYVYATSYLEVKDLSIYTSDSNGTPIYPTTYNFYSTNTASLNGVPTIQMATCSGTFGGSTTCGPGLPGTPVLDPLVAAIPAGARGGQNNYAYVGTGSQYGSADSVIWNAELVNPNTKTHTQQIAESNLLSGTDAGGSAELQSVTKFLYNFAVGSGLTANVTINFDANPDLMAAINDPTATAATAQANMRFVLQLTQNNGNGLVIWHPRGTFPGPGTNDCTIANVAGGVCTETNDGEDLNNQVSVATTPVSSAAYSYNNGVLSPFGLKITGLTAGDWSFSLDALTSENVTRVPEPGTLLLLGAGLVGLGIARGRRGRAAPSA